MAVLLVARETALIMLLLRPVRPAQRSLTAATLLRPVRPLMLFSSRGPCRPAYAPDRLDRQLCWASMMAPPAARETACIGACTGIVDGYAGAAVRDYGRPPAARALLKSPGQISLLVARAAALIFLLLRPGRPALHGPPGHDTPP